MELGEIFTENVRFKIGRLELSNIFKKNIETPGRVYRQFWSHVKPACDRRRELNVKQR